LVLTARDVYHLHSYRLPALVAEAYLVVWAYRGVAHYVRRRAGPAPLGWLAPSFVLASLLAVWLSRTPDEIILFGHTTVRGQPGGDPAQAAILSYWEQPDIAHAGPIRLPPQEARMWEDLVAYVRHNSRPGASIFVAPGAPGLYLFTERDPPTRFLLFYPGMVDEAHEQEILQDLVRANLDLVVFNFPPEKDFCGKSFAAQCPTLYRWIVANFRLATRIGTFQIYVRAASASPPATFGSLP